MAAPDRPVLYALFGQNRAGQVLHGTVLVLAVTALVGWQLLPDLQFSDQDEQLFRAARHGDRTAVESALSAGASLEHAAPVDRKTALFRAAVFGHADVVRLLLARSADPQRSAPPPVEARTFAPAAVDMRAAEWQVAALAHVSGQFDGPAAAVARWSPDVTRVVVDRAIRRARDRSSRVLDDSAPGTDRDYRTVLAKALMLHTDIAIAERTGEATATAGPHAWTMLDAKPLGSMRISIHWGLARVLAAPLAKDPAGASIARAWYRAVGGLYQQWADLGQLRAHLAAGAELFSEDPVLLLYLGTLHQTHADARVQSYNVGLRGSQGGLPDRFVRTLSIEDADTELGFAEYALRRAIAVDPLLVEARIRLAHVQGARGKSAAAVALARTALASPLPRFLEYYGAMVLGRAEARVGHHAEARAAFERAAASYPQSQAAQVALSHVGLAEGRTANGVAALVRTMGPDADETIEDPWSAYFRLHEPEAKSYFDDLRRSVK